MPSWKFLMPAFAVPAVLVLAVTLAGETVLHLFQADASPAAMLRLAVQLQLWPCAVMLIELPCYWSSLRGKYVREIMLHELPIIALLALIICQMLIAWALCVMLLTTTSDSLNAQHWFPLTWLLYACNTLCMWLYSRAWLRRAILAKTLRRQ